MVFLLEKICKLIDYKNIKFVSENKIEVIYSKKKIEIYGNNLSLSFYSKEESLIKGKIINIQIYDIH